MFYAILILSVLSFIFAIIIIKRGIKDAKLMPENYEVLSRAEMAAINQGLDKEDKNCPDEFSPEAYFGEDDSEIEALKEKLAKYQDYSDVSEDDLRFLSHITQ